MEEDMSSIVSNGGATGRAEATDSTGSMHSLSPPPSPPPPPPPSKRARHGGCRVSSSTKFKGVVPQQNGHWGAQIYANHQRIWLGTFKSEKEAAMAYDSAAIRIRNGDSHRNFPWTEATLEEPKFQDHHTTDQLLNMIKDGSYQSKFDEFLRARFKNAVAGTGLYSSARAQSKRGGLVFKQLFEKELTPSDVGKLNRLVIPKKYAVKHFPRIAEFNQTAAANKAEGGSGTMEDNNDEILLVFHDTAMRSWKFRYCYWKSSQSFVFTRGWNRFVKEKRLRENDTVTFYSCECSREGDKEPPRTVFVIDIIRFEDATNGELVERANDNSNTNSDNNTTNKECVGLSLELKVGLKQCANHDEDEKEVEMELVEKANKQVGEAGNSGFRLFGVQIL